MYKLLYTASETNRRRKLRRTREKRLLCPRSILKLRNIAHGTEQAPASECRKCGVRGCCLWREEHGYTDIF